MTHEEGESLVDRVRHAFGRDTDDDTHKVVNRPAGPDYAADVARAGQLQPLVAKGLAGSLVEAALRFAITGDALSTVLIGCSDLSHLEQAVAAVDKGPLPPGWGQVLHSDIFAA